MRAQAPRRQDKIDQIRSIIDESTGLSTSGKLLRILSTVQEPSNYELLYGFFPTGKRYKKSLKGVEGLLELTAQELHERHYLKAVKDMVKEFRKSEKGKWFVVRTILNTQNQWVLKLIKTEDEYKKYGIDDRIKSILEGLKDLNRQDHRVLAMSQEERKKLIKEQIALQIQRLKERSKNAK